MRYAIGICGLFLAIVTFTVIWIAPASSGGPLEGLRPISKKNLCAVIEHDYKLAVLEHNRTLIKQLADDIVKYRCVTKIPPVTTAKVCSQGITNIQTFLQTCPTADPAFGAILQAFPVSFDGAVQSSASLSQDLNLVCAYVANPSAPAPSAKQNAEYTALQVLRTIYAMDGQGTEGCAYPWTKGASLYVWMKSLVGGIDIRDDSAYSDCCEMSSGGKAIIALMEPAANQYPIDYQWMGIANQLALYIHETRHAPGNNNPNTGVPAYLHSTCCPEQGNSPTAACDNTYHEADDMAPYATQYWLFRAWLNGTVKVGYACMAPSDVQETSQLFASAAQGYIGRFCTSPPPSVSMPANPGGTCP